jgi:hypothetical protein
MDIWPDTINERFSDFNMYTNFVVYYISAIIGLQHFQKEKYSTRFSTYVTVSDGAFTVLTLENNWNCWMAMSKNEHWKDLQVPTKWMVTRDKKTTSGIGKSKNKTVVSDLENTTNGTPQGPTARRFCGWSAHGINRYNQLFDQIKKERASMHGKRFETTLLNHFKKELEKNPGGREKKTRIEPPLLPTPKHELWTALQPVTSIPQCHVEVDAEESASKSNDETNSHTIVQKHAV